MRIFIGDCFYQCLTGFYDKQNLRLTLLLISSYSAYFRIWTSFISFFISSASICLIAPARRRGSAELLHPWIQKRTLISIHITKTQSEINLNRQKTRILKNLNNLQSTIFFSKTWKCGWEESLSKSRCQASKPKYITYWKKKF